MSPVSFIKAVTGELKIKYMAHIMVLSVALLWRKQGKAILKEIWKKKKKRDLMKRLTDLGNELTVAWGKRQLGTSGRSRTHCYI